MAFSKEETNKKKHSKDKLENQMLFAKTKLGIYGALTVAFCCALVISNVLAVKTITIGPFALPASILTFPLVYIINDVLSDIFGFRAMRFTIFCGFIAISLAALSYHLAIAIPGVDQNLSDAFATTLGSSWRILLATFASYILGSLLNSYVMAGLKERFNKYIFFRCIVSTVAGETVDSVVFISVSFIGIYEPAIILTMIGSQILFKTLYEIVMYPVTRKVLLVVREKVKTENILQE